MQLSAIPQLRCFVGVWITFGFFRVSPRAGVAFTTTATARITLAKRLEEGDMARDTAKRDYTRLHIFMPPQSTKSKKSSAFALFRTLVSLM